MTTLGFELIGFTKQNSKTVEQAISLVPGLESQRYTTSQRGARIGYIEVEGYEGDREKLIRALKDALAPHGVQLKGGEEPILLNVERRTEDLLLRKP